MSNVQLQKADCFRLLHSSSNELASLGILSECALVLLVLAVYNAPATIPACREMSKVMQFSYVYTHIECVCVKFMYTYYANYS